MNIVEYNEKLKTQYIGSGFNGTCYLTDENQVFKLFNNPSLYEDNIERLVGVYSSTYVFPSQLVSLNSTIIGYIMEYVEGVELKYLNKEISLSEYVNALKIAEYNVAAISNFGICSCDVGSSNILFSTDKKFKVIDTDFYKRRKIKKGLYSHNLGDFSVTALEPILDVYDSIFFDKSLRKEKRYLIDGKLCPSKYIEMLLRYMNITSSDISINDFSNQLKLLYKTHE